MSGTAATADYKTDSSNFKSGEGPGSARRPSRPTTLAAAVPERAMPARPAATTLEEFLHLLAKALRQFHTYPATSPLCVDALTACHTALGQVDASERLLLVVDPHALRAGDISIGAGTLIERELAHRLHGARVSTIEIDRGASVRDLSRLCSDLMAYQGGIDGAPTLAETLAEHGVDRIVLTTSHEPAVLNVGAPPVARTHVLARDRERRAAASVKDAPSIHLYPPDTGWIRMDPGVDLGSVSLPDLAVLADDPMTLATMLLQLADDDPPGTVATPARALERKFSDVTKLFGALEPQLARVMFAKLAGAVLALDSNRRKVLLQRTVLPGLLDGKTDGTILKDFPDVDLADALSLLLDIETAAPELLATALDRLELPSERREAMAPLLEERVRTRLADACAGERGESALDERTRQLIRISSGDSKSFKEFWAYDLSIDAAAADTIARVETTIRETDLLTARLECAFHLIRLEPSPAVVERLLRSALLMIGDLERAQRWSDQTRSLARLGALARELREPHPDVADVIQASLGLYFDSARVGRLLAMYEAGGEQHAAANEIVAAVGSALATPLFERIKGAERHTLERSVIPLMCEHAAVLAPGLTSHVGEGSATATMVMVRVLGFAGAGYEDVIARGLDHPDEAIVREALRALTRTGTAAAAAAVSGLIRRGDSQARGPAEEALWHFAPEHVHAQVLVLLRTHAFVLDNPSAATRLLDRAGRSREHGLEPALAGLAPLRFRFWNPALRRVGTRAHSLMRRA